MQNTSELWKQLYSNPDHKSEFKIEIVSSDGREHVYRMNSIIDISVNSDLFAGGSPKVGQCVSAHLKTSLYLPNDDIVKKSQLTVFQRLTYRNTVSEWISHGTYFVDKHSRSKIGVTTIDAYDSMLKGDKAYYNIDGDNFIRTVGDQQIYDLEDYALETADSFDPEEWPKSDIQMVKIIASRYIGVTLHPNVEAMINKSYEVQYPGFGEGAYTIRQILGFIASMYGGSFIIDESNRLKFIRLFDKGNYTHEITDEISSEFETLGVPKRYSRVSIKVGIDEMGEDLFYTSGDDDYDELLIDCPWGTQEICDALCEDICKEENVYVGYASSYTIIDPAFQIGDSIRYEDISSFITCYTKSFEPLFTADISATGESELESEYPYVSQAELQQRQTNANTLSKLIVSSNEIRGEIRDTQTAQASQISQTKEELRVEITSATNAVNDRIDNVASKTLYLTVTENGLQIGRNNERFYVLITPDTMEFHDGPEVVAYISNQKLYITQSEIKNELRIGNYSFIKRNDNSMSLKWINETSTLGLEGE